MLHTTGREVTPRSHRKGFTLCAISVKWSPNIVTHGTFLHGCKLQKKIFYLSINVLEKVLSLMVHLFLCQKEIYRNLK